MDQKREKAREKEAMELKVLAGKYGGEVRVR